MNLTLYYIIYDIVSESLCGMELEFDLLNNVVSIILAKKNTNFLKNQLIMKHSTEKTLLRW